MILYNKLYYKVYFPQKDLKGECLLVVARCQKSFVIQRRV
jgi:hypothetical protein